MDNYWIQVKPYNIPNTCYTIHGYSWAACATGFIIPELDILLDCGVPNKYFPQFVFVTHGHLDHVYQLPLCNIDAAKSGTKIVKKPVYYVPAEIKNYVYNFIHSTYVMSKYNPGHRMHNKYELIPVHYNDNIMIEIKKQQWMIKVFKCDHGVPCIGYGFTQIRHKLKEEYQSLPGKDIQQLRKDGITITEPKEYPIFCFLGDTTTIVLENNDIFRYPTILIECTYLYDDDIDNATKNKHVHWLLLEPYVKSHPENTFILYHFSKRYTVQDIRSFFANILYQNIVLWC